MMEVRWKLPELEPSAKLDIGLRRRMRTSFEREQRARRAAPFVPLEGLIYAFMLVVCVLYAAGTAVQIFRESLLREAHSTMTLDAPLRAGFLSFFAAPFVDLSKSAASWGARVVFSQLNSERPK